MNHIKEATALAFSLQLLDMKGLKSHHKAFFMGNWGKRSNPFVVEFFFQKRRVHCLINVHSQGWALEAKWIIRVICDEIYGRFKEGIFWKQLPMWMDLKDLLSFLVHLEGIILLEFRF
jgi:hypothetical protein